MKKSKRAKASEHVEGIDMISNLPDHVLHLILSGLPTTEEVIRTSILSTRWMYLWTSIPSLDFDYSRGLKPPKKFRKNKFKEFVYWVLVNKSLDQLDSFRLCCSNYYSMSTVGRWIHTAVRRNVKVVDLMFHPKEKPTATEEYQYWVLREEFEDIEVPLSLTTCSSLEVLKLFLYRRRLSLPTFTGFPTLRVLELNNVELACDDVVVEDCFKNLPLLEDLSLIYCLIEKLECLCISCPKLKNLRIVNRETIQFRRWYDDSVEEMCRGVRISCPKLMFLELVGPIANRFLFESLDSLKTAVIHVEDIDRDGLSLSGMSRVEYLSLNLYTVEVDVRASLPNLKTLELTINDYTLEAKFLNEMDLFMSENWHQDEVATIRILAGKLRKVEFLEFYEFEWLLDLARFFLEHGNALEEMVFIWVYKARYHKESMEILKKVSNFQKASSAVKLITLLRPRSC